MIHAFTKSSWKDLLFLTSIVGSYYGLLNLLYFYQHGWLATHGVDIWFYLVVARGQQYLTPLDVTRWLVQPVSFLSNENAFLALTLLSVFLHLVSVLLVYHYLGKYLQPRKSRFLWSLLFAFLPHHLSLTTASFTHFTVAQPFLIVAFGRLIPWCLFQIKRPDIWGLLCLLESALIGPEGFFMTLLLVCIRLAGSRHKFLVAIFGIILLLVVAIFFDHLFKVWSVIGVWLRGIDLAWQRRIGCGDLLPLKWKVLSIFGWFHMVWVALMFYAFFKRQFLIGYLLLFFLVLTFHVVRAFFALELVGFISLLVLFSQRNLRWVHPLIIWLILLGIFAHKQVAFPIHLVRMARIIHEHAISNQRIACSPTYGFFFQAWTNLPTTDDLHHRSESWTHLVSSDPNEANQWMLDKKISFLILTNYDFRFERNGYWSTSGLGETLQKLDDNQFRNTVAVLLNRNPLLVTPLGILSRQDDTESKQSAFCFIPTHRN